MAYKVFADKAMWSAKEADYLSENYHKYSAEYIGNVLGRTASSVQMKARRMGLLKGQKNNPKQVVTWRNGEPVFRTPNGREITRTSFENLIRRYSSVVKLARYLGYKDRGGVQHIKNNVFCIKKSFPEIRAERPMSLREEDWMEWVHVFLLRNRYAPSFSELACQFKVTEDYARERWRSIIENGYGDGIEDRMIRLTDSGIELIFGSCYFEDVEEMYATDYTNKGSATT